VTLVARGEHLAAIRGDGLRLEAPDGTVTAVQVPATDDPATIAPVDVVLLAVKTWQVPAVLSGLPPLLGDGSAVLTTQNGVEAPDQVASVVGQDAVLPGVARIFAMIAEPGLVRHAGGPASLTFAEWDNRPSARVERLRAALAESGARAVVADDVWVDLWAKLLFVVPLGELGSVLASPIGELRAAGRRPLLVDLMREVEAVARAREVALPATVVDDVLGFVDRQPADGTTSLQRDLLAGRPSELDAWTGGVVRAGEQAGVPVPLHRLLLEVLRTRHPQALPSS
jgi:2-dehydropantoate 2-reductase